MNFGGRHAGLLVGVLIAAWTPQAFASGHFEIPIWGFLVAMLWKAWPLVIAWAVGLGTFFGRASGLKSIVGAVSSGIGTIAGRALVRLFAGDQSWILIATMVGLLVMVTHVIQLGIQLLRRARGGRISETVKRWRRYL